VKRKIPCFCDNIIEAEVPEEIDLDSNSENLEKILDGSFLNFICPRCNKKHKPEWKLMVLWPSKKMRFEVFPELDRGEFYRRKKTPQEKNTVPLETIIGYPEMADRLAVLRDGYEPVAIEAIKYFLHLKAEEQYPDDEIEIWYFGTDEKDKSLEFHIHGIKVGEVAVMKVPRAVYEKNLGEYRKNPKSEIFTALRVRSYLSVKNTMRPEELK
jgi:hypothetical protein